MLTRGMRPMCHQYGDPGPLDQSAPPFHVTMPPAQYPVRAVSASGGLRGGVVQLNTSGWTGIRRGNTGYGYLGLDPSDPSTWVTRQFRPQPTTAWFTQ